MTPIQLPKDPMNRVHNSMNPHQGTATKSLCVCSAGLLRSPSIARFLQETQGHNVRACGVSQDYALVPISETLLTWADEIHVVAEQSDYVEAQLKYFDLEDTPVFIYDIPDQYGTFDPVLMEIIKEQFKGFSK